MSANCPDCEKLQKHLADVSNACGAGQTEAIMASGASRLLISLAITAGSNKTTILQEGVTYADQECGDWKVTVEKVTT